MKANMLDLSATETRDGARKGGKSWISVFQFDEQQPAADYSVIQQSDRAAASVITQPPLQLLVRGIKCVRLIGVRVRHQRVEGHEQEERLESSDQGERRWHTETDDACKAR